MQVHIDKVIIREAIVNMVKGHLKPYGMIRYYSQHVEDNQVTLLLFQQISSSIQ